MGTFDGIVRVFNAQIIDRAILCLDAPLDKLLKIAILQNFISKNLNMCHKISED